VVPSFYTEERTISLKTERTNPRTKEAQMSTGLMDEKVKSSVLPFGIEIDHPRNCDVLLQCIPNARLRSAIDGTKPALDKKTGNLIVPLDQSKAFAAFPRTPGMQIHVNPSELTYVILDPLHGDKEMIERIKMFFRATSGQILSERFDGVPPQNGTLDVHRMKSLCREMVWLVKGVAPNFVPEAKRCKGAIPTLTDIEELPGHFLLNPGSQVGNTQPRYEKDWDQWVNRLSAGGG